MEGCASLQKEQYSSSLGRAREPAIENQLHAATSNMVITKFSIAIGPHFKLHVFIFHYI